MKVSARFVACAAGMVTGFVIMTLPSLSRHGWPGSFSKLVRDAVERLSFTQVVFLVIVGFLWGLALRRPYSRDAALCQLAAFPIFAIYEMVFVDATSHNLWPFEFGIYGLLTLAPMLGLKISDVLRRRFDV